MALAPTGRVHDGPPAAAEEPSVTRSAPEHPIVLPPEGRALSPRTGWTRAHWEAVARGPVGSGPGRVPVYRRLAPGRDAVGLLEKLLVAAGRVRARRSAVSSSPVPSGS